MTMKRYTCLLLLALAVTGPGCTTMRTALDDIHGAAIRIVDAAETVTTNALSSMNLSSVQPVD